MEEKERDCLKMQLSFQVLQMVSFQVESAPPKSLVSAAFPKCSKTFGAETPRTADLAPHRMKAKTRCKSPRVCHHLSGMSQLTVLVKFKV